MRNWGKFLGRNSPEERTRTLFSAMLRDIFKYTLNMAWHLTNCGKSCGKRPWILCPVTLARSPGITWVPDSPSHRSCSLYPFWLAPGRGPSLPLPIGIVHMIYRVDGHLAPSSISSPPDTYEQPQRKQIEQSKYQNLSSCCQHVTFVYL